MKHLLLSGLWLLWFLIGIPSHIISEGDMTPGMSNPLKEILSGQQNDDKKQKFNTEEFLNSAPSFQIRKLTLLNEAGDTMRYEDGSTKYHYVMYDKEGKVCHPETAKKLTNASILSGAKGAAKIAGGVVAGIVAAKLVSKFFSKKKAVKYIIIAAGGVAGILWAKKDIQNIRKKTALLKEYKTEINKYQTTFSDEGLPLEANADLSDYTDCEELTANAIEIKDQLAQSLADGMPMEALSDEELDKQEQENSKQLAQFDTETDELLKSAEELGIK